MRFLLKTEEYQLQEVKIFLLMIFSGIADQVTNLLAQGRRFFRCFQSCMMKKLDSCAPEYVYNKNKKTNSSLPIFGKRNLPHYLAHSKFLVYFKGIKVSESQILPIKLPKMTTKH